MEMTTMDSSTRLESSLRRQLKVRAKIEQGLEQCPLYPDKYSHPNMTWLMADHGTY
jgi:hypothetical protein